MSRFLPTILILSFSHLFSYSHDIDTVKFISIEKLVSSQMVDATFSGLGGHSGDCMQMVVKNRKSDSVFVWVEGGRRLTSEDEGLQDIFLAKNAALALAPGQTDSIPLFGFCCQASKGGPKKKSKFNVGFMAPAIWIAFANFVEKHNFPTGALQSAVWVLSDNHDISSIYADDASAIKPLKEKLGELLNIEVPWYSYTYVDEPEELFSDEAENVHGEVEFYLSTNTIISVLIKDPRGGNFLKLIDGIGYDPGTYTFSLDTDVRYWPRGKYTLVVYEEGGRPITKQVFDLK